MSNYSDVFDFLWDPDSKDQAELIENGGESLKSKPYQLHLHKHHAIMFDLRKLDVFNFSYSFSVLFLRFALTRKLFYTSKRNSFVHVD